MKPGDSARCVTAGHGKVTILRFADDRLLDDEVVSAVADELRAFADMPEIKLILDLGNVTIVSSAMLGHLLALQRWVRNGKGALALANLKPSVLEILRISKLDGIFDIYRDVNAALVAWR